jgi:hypothetical protein
MLNNGENIEDLFGDAFREAEINPPSNMWENVETSLNNKGVESIYKNAFVNNSINPSRKIWYRISYILFLQNFLKFNPTSFNVYYAAITAFVGVTCFNIFHDNSKISPTPKSISTTVTKETINTQKNESIAEYSKQQTQEISTNKTIVNNTSVTTTEKTSKTETGLKPTKTSPQSPVETFDFTKITIKGNTKLCTAMQSDYVIDGAPMESNIEWNLTQKDGIYKFITTHKVTASWNKSGTYIVSALVSVGKNKKKIELPVTVEESTDPVIKGKNKVCEGIENQLYSIDEPVDKHIRYDWKAKQNHIDLTGNKYVNIDWNKSGRDTLFVTRFNTETGCKSQSSLAVMVSPKPNIDFEMNPLSNSEFEFKYIGNIKKPTLTWTINGNQFDDETFVYENTGISTSIVTLQVKDKNNCVNTIQKEVSFNKHVLFVPKNFTTSDNDGFMPQTNNTLKSYKIEIFNARNEKVWESTELNDGKPAKAWDGTFKGAEVPRGKYYWRINAIFDDGSQWKGVSQPNGDTKPNGIFILEN